MLQLFECILKDCNKKTLLRVFIACHHINMASFKFNELTNKLIKENKLRVTAIESSTEIRPVIYDHLIIET
jgi:hypothetical protein